MGRGKWGDKKASRIMIEKSGGGLLRLLIVRLVAGDAW